MKTSNSIEIFLGKEKFNGREMNQDRIALFEFWPDSVIVKLIRKTEKHGVVIDDEFTVGSEHINLLVNQYQNWNQERQILEASADQLQLTENKDEKNESN